MNISGMTSTQWEIDQLIKTKLFADEQAVLRSALQALFQVQPHLKQQMVIRTYAAGEISLGKAAELLGISHEEMKDILIENSTEIHLGPRTVDELLEDAAHA
jgi:predicted HTH domain antitoxin